MTLFTGRVVKHFSVATSTNELANEALKSGNVIEGTLFRADGQTAGKGQRGRYWVSASGQNILASYVFYPNFLRSDQQFQLIKAISLAVKDVLDKYLFEKASIKWPNHLYTNNRKIGGILVETIMKGDFMGSSIVGIGLNVNQRDFGEIHQATSLANETGKGYNVDQLIDECSFQLEKRYLQLKSNVSKCDHDYQQALYCRNKKTWYRINGKRVELIPRGVDELGRLILENEGGRQNAFALHEVQQIIT